MPKSGNGRPSVLTDQVALIEVEEWEEISEVLNCTDTDQTRARLRGPCGWHTKLITPALDHEGRPSQVTVGTVLTEDGRLLIAIRVGHDGDEVVIPGPATASEHIANVEQVRDEKQRHDTRHLLEWSGMRS